MRIDVRRSQLVEDALRAAAKKKFDPSKSLKVTFVGEFAIDHGGPLRDFFRLFSLRCSEIYLRGGARGKYFDGNAAAVQDRIFFRMGQFFSMSVVQVGIGFPFLCEAIFKYICEGSTDGVKD
jgi:hypothetical protein